MRKQSDRNSAPSQTEELLKAYRKRIAKEGWLTSLLCGATVGFCVDIVCSAVFLLLGIKMFWISILAMVLATAISTPIFYFCRFRRSTRQVAARVDTLGLEERILTMAQFEGDDSYMARRQREDAMETLKKVGNTSLLRLAVSIPVIVACAATCVLSVGATTASALVDKGILETIEGQREEANKPTFEVVYGIQDEEGGRVEGELLQTVTAGEATTPVEAIADEDYYFAGWTDGYEQPLRSDTVVDQGFSVYAIFLPIEDSEEEEGNDGGDGEDGNSGSDKGDKSGQEGENTPGDGGEGDGEGMGGSSSGPNSQVIDGSTNLGDVSGEATSDAQSSVNSNGDLGEGEIGTIGDYFGGIAQ